MFRVYLAIMACLAALAGAPALAQSGQTSNDTINNSAAEKFGAPRTATAGNNNNAQSNGQDKSPIGCSRGDWLAGKCTTHPSEIHPGQSDPDADPYRDRYPGQYPGPRYRRPIVIVPTPAPAPIDETPLASDWEGCRKAKLNQLNLTQSGNLERAKQLDEWLWKNCRSYSEDLRQLEQDRM